MTQNRIPFWQRVVALSNQCYDYKLAGSLKLTSFNEPYLAIEQMDHIRAAKSWHRRDMTDQSLHSNKWPKNRGAWLVQP